MARRLDHAEQGVLFHPRDLGAELLVEPKVFAVTISELHAIMSAGHSQAL